MMLEGSEESTGRLFRGGLAVGIEGRGAVGGSIAGCDRKSVVVAVAAIIVDIPPIFSNEGQSLYRAATKTNFDLTDCKIYSIGRLIYCAFSWCVCRDSQNSVAQLDMRQVRILSRQPR